jgi:4-hydroxybenzoate polyprenyltransferase
MAANRVIDRQLDARNPRTAQRELVTGAMSTRTAVIGAAVALVVFLAAAAALSPLCLALSPIVLVALAGYPYAKRVTSLCHYILGLAQALAPVGAFIAVSGRWGSTRFLGLLHSAPLSAAIVLGLAVGLWIAGFDVIYACQDIESDRAEGVHSIPARFGARAALVISAVTHVATVALFVAFGVVAHFSWPWYLGVGLAAAALVYEHVIVKPDDLSRVNRAWFTVNGFIGVGLFGFALADLVHRGLRA